MLKIIMPEKWTDKHQKLLDDIRSFCQPDSIVAILGERTFTFLKHDTDDVDEMISRCKKNMHEADSTMPDFTYLPLDEGGLVYLDNGNIAVYLNKEEARWGDKVPKEDFVELLVYRAMCQEAARLGQLIALDIPE